MSEAAKVIEIKSKPEQKKARQIRVRLETVDPTRIVEVWKLYEHSIREGEQPISFADDSMDVIRGHLFSMLHNPNIIGLLAMVGRRPVGLVLASVNQRAFGHPHRFAYLWTIWVEPDYRGTRVMPKMMRELFERLKRVGIRHWESDATEKLAAQLTKTRWAKIAYHRMTGSI